MARKSQVDKFRARESKKAVDEEAINTRSYQKSQEEINRHGAEGVGELMKHGNIKEAAVVFSYEGMGAFANMFGNSMESAVIRVLDNHIDRITQTMEQRIESIVESKMVEMMEGMAEGMKKFQSEQHQHSSLINVDTNIQAKLQEEMNKILEAKEETQVDLVKELISVEKEAEKEQRIKASENPVETPIIDWEKAYAIEDKEKKAKSAISKGNNNKGARAYTRLIEPGYGGLKVHSPVRKLGITVDDVKMASPYIITILKAYEGQPVKSSDIVRTMANDFGIKLANSTGMMKKVMSIDPNIENVEFGFYKYEEKTFHPTV